MRRMTDKKTLILFSIIYVVVFAVMNMLVFFVFNEKNNVFWISYGFMCAAFVIQIVSMFLAVKALEVEAVFFGIPLASISLFYFFAAVFISAVFMIFQNAPVKLAIALQVIVLAVYLVIAVIALMARDTVQDVNDNIKVSVVAIRSMQADVETLKAQAQDPALKEKLRKLSETIRYSDPMSNDAVTDIEGRIMQALNELRICCENGQNADAAKKCGEIEVLFLQRNNLLKATK